MFSLLMHICITWPQWVNRRMQLSTQNVLYTGIILCMRPANERQCYSVTPSLIGWGHTHNVPSVCRETAVTHWNYPPPTTVRNAASKWNHVNPNKICWTSQTLIMPSILNSLLIYRHPALTEPKHILLMKLWGTPPNEVIYYTLRYKQNGCHFADGIFKHLFVFKITACWLRFHWCLFLTAHVQLTINQQWFR